MTAEPKAPHSRAGKLIQWSLAVLACVFLGWLVVKTSAPSALLKNSPAVAAAIAPDDPRVAMRLAVAEMLAQAGRVDPRTQTRVFSALADLPLSSEPFLIAAATELGRGNSAKAEPLLQQAVRRNPRSRLARLLLLDRYLRTGSLEQTLAEMQALRKLIPDAAGILAGELAKFARSEETRRTLKGLLAKDATIRADVLEQLAREGADPEIIMELARVGPVTGAASKSGWQSIMVASLIQKGDVQRAYGFWQQFTGTPNGGSENPLNLQFQTERSGIPPFSWDFTEGNLGVAEPVNASALDISYYGREAGSLAQRLIMIEPGRYALSFSVEGDGRSDGGKAMWSMSCKKGGPTLVELPLQGTPSGSNRISGEFTVPAGCGSQWIALKVVPAELPKTQTWRISDLKLQRLG